MHEDLVKRLRSECALPYSALKDMREAADAIEELICEVATEHNARLDAEERYRWIPVTERLPQEWWPVLGLIQFHDEKEPPAQEVLWYLGNGHWRETWRGDMIESAVTHWMPLPFTPKLPNGEWV